MKTEAYRNNEYFNNSETYLIISLRSYLFKFQFQLVEMPNEISGNLENYQLSLIQNFYVRLEENDSSFLKVAAGNACKSSYF